MEVGFGAESYSSHFDEFMRFYLVIHTGNYRIKKGDVYLEFKHYSRKHEVEPLFRSLKEFANYYCNIALGKESDRVLAEPFQDIRELRADVCYPLLMELYHDYSEARIGQAEFVEVILLVESYVFRRAVCDIPTNSLRQTFSTFSRKVKKDRYVESVKAEFLKLPSYRRFPADEEFVRQLKVRNLYAFNRRSYWLRRFENFGRKERVAVQDYTIEHIMPQNDKLGVEWIEALGEDWQQIHEKYIHTLGNLTLTGYNSEYSDKPFTEKRDMEGGFRHSPLKVNQGLAECENWNEAEIVARADRLAREAVNVWGFPALTDDVLAAYRVTEDSKEGYTIDSH